LKLESRGQSWTDIIVDLDSVGCECVN
jgi:hypothetical protein